MSSINELASRAAKRRAKQRKSATSVRPKRFKNDYSPLDLTDRPTYMRLMSDLNSSYDDKYFAPYAREYIETHYARKFNSLPDFRFSLIGKICYIEANQGKLPGETIEFRRQKIRELLDRDSEPEEGDEEKPTEKRLSVQDHIKNRTHDLMAEIDEWIDTGNMGMTLAKHIKDSGLKSLNTALIEEKYIKLLREITSAVKQDDPQVVEAYRNHTPAMLKSIQAFLVRIVKDGREFVSEKISTRKPRTKKPVSPEKMVSKVKFMARDDALGLSSIDPRKAIDCEQLWVYNAKKRMLGCYRAAAGTFLQFKGSTVLNYDEGKSFSKKLRKPEDQVKDVMQAGKVVLRTFLDSIRAKSKPLNGRLNGDTLLLKAL